MNWTLPSILESVADAWSVENWPYTLAFWIVVGAAGWALTRKRKQPPNSS